MALIGPLLPDTFTSFLSKLHTLKFLGLHHAQVQHYCFALIID